MNSALQPECSTRDARSCIRGSDGEAPALEPAHSLEWCDYRISS